MPLYLDIVITTKKQCIVGRQTSAGAQRLNDNKIYEEPKDPFLGFPAASGGDLRKLNSRKLKLPVILFL
jgi:hypothetical protein